MRKMAMNKTSFNQKNSITKREVENKIIESLDITQLVHSDNKINVKNELEDSPKIFVKSLGTNFANHTCDLCDPSPIVLTENRRFSFDHTDSQKKIVKRID